MELAPKRLDQDRHDLPVHVLAGVDQRQNAKGVPGAEANAGGRAAALSCGRHSADFHHRVFIPII